MNREELIAYIENMYGSCADHPWEQYPGHTVFRGSSGKWFALLMDVPKEKIGASGDGNLDILNVKCEPAMIGSLLREPGFYPAYHMNKENWITIALDGSVGRETIEMLLDMSLNLSSPKKKRGRG